MSTIGLTREELIRVAWKFKSDTEAAARQRQAIAPSGQGLSPEIKRARSRQLLADKIGMKPTTFYHCEQVIKVVDRLKVQDSLESQAEADKLIALLNEQSVYAAYTKAMSVKKEKGIKIT